MLVDSTKKHADDPERRGIDHQLALNILLEQGGSSLASEGAWGWSGKGKGGWVGHGGRAGRGPTTSCHELRGDRLS